MVFVPPRFAADSILEAEDAGIELIVTITEGIPAHDELQGLQPPRPQPERPAGGPELPGDPLPRQGQRGDHPRLLLQGGQRGRGVALGHAHLPDRQRAGPERIRQQLDRGHRRRPGAGLELHRRDRAVRGRPGDRADRALGRDRRRRRGARGRLHRRARDQARGGLHRRASPRRPARRWATPARSCPAPPAPPRRRPRRSRPRACGWAATPRRSRRSRSRVLGARV